MRMARIAAAALAAGALHAQGGTEPDKRFQLFVEQSQPSNLVITSSAAQVQDRPGTLNGIGFRMMGEIPGAPGLYFEGGGRFNSSSRFRFNGSVPGGGALDLRNLKFSDSYWSVGAAYLVQPSAQLSFGLHLEGRGEYLRLRGGFDSSLVGSLPVYKTVTYLRPWARVSADLTFTGIGTLAHPFLGVDLSGTPMKTTQPQVPDPTHPDARFVKALAPQWAYGAYLGVRF